MVLALTITMALLVTASQIFFTRVISDQLIEQGSRYAAADGFAVERAYREGDGSLDSIDDALDLVDSIEDRPDVVTAVLFDSRQREVIVPRDGGPVGIEAGEFDPNPKFDQALSDGLSYSGVETESDDDGSTFEFIVPVKFDGKAYVIEVNQDATALNTQVSALRDKTVIFTSIALAGAMGLFYLIAGRALMLRHGRARKGARRDGLTDLGNHRVFHEELAAAVSFGARHDDQVALALIDIDDFKLVNDRFGHKRGDEVLTECAGILDSGRAEDRAFRIGGDEFALLMPGTDDAQARVILERCLAEAGSGASPTSLSAGIASIPPGVEVSPAALSEQADAALYEGKHSGGGQVIVFDEVAGRLSVVTPDKVESLRALFAEPRIETAFQPIWDLHENRILGYEALARPWSGYGFDGPAEAFRVAEKVGRGHELDALCRDAALGRAHDLPADVLLFLNINPQSLTRGPAVSDQLASSVRAAGLEPERVVLEITERSPARLDHVTASARKLRALGFKLAIDDVGAGTSGLEILQELQVEFVKIDRSIIVAAIEDPKAQAVLVGILAFASLSNAFLIAEGIESEEILSFVRRVHELEIGELEIGGGQGFLLGRPDCNLKRAPYRLSDPPDKVPVGGRG
jgi:diguanylate cyclase (GGDEF)-like protein